MYLSDENLSTPANPSGGGGGGDVFKDYVFPNFWYNLRNLAGKIKDQSKNSYYLTKPKLIGINQIIGEHVTQFDLLINTAINFCI